MAEVSERHEVWVRRKDNNVVFAAERHKMAPKTKPNGNASRRAVEQLKCQDGPACRKLPRD